MTPLVLAIFHFNVNSYLFLGPLSIKKSKLTPNFIKYVLFIGMHDIIISYIIMSMTVNVISR